MNGSPRSLPASDLYVMYSMSNSPYQRWQADLLDFSAGESAQPGEIVRLCSLDRDHARLGLSRSSVGTTFETPSYAELGHTWGRRLVRWAKRKLLRDAPGRYHFYCLNKPFGMRAFLEAHPELEGDARLLWLDPDMVFTQAWDPREEVRPGLVSGQRWWGYDRTWCEEAVGGGLEAPADDSALMFPFCISVADMRRISDSFCALSEQIYRRTRDWKSEMCALVLAMSKAGLECRPHDALGTCNDWPDGLPDDSSAAISHYTQPMRDRRGSVIWDKRTYTPQTLARPWGRPPDPDVPATLTDRRTLQTLHSLIDAQESTQPGVDRTQGSI